MGGALLTTGNRCRFLPVAEVSQQNAIGRQGQSEKSIFAQAQCL
jgi:hypothetical protein